jgi:hypothetical protein
MQASKVSHSMATSSKPARQYIYIAIIFIVVLVVAIYINNAYQALKPPALSSDTVILSQSAFEAKYGLHVNLIAVTGAGGFVDLRLKITDGAKAKVLLADKKNFPSLFVTNGITLNAPDDTKTQPIDYVSGGNLYIMYPNGGDSVHPGEPVQIVFGNTALEPIISK